MKICAFILSGLWAFWASHTSAADMRSIEVDYVDGRYSVESVVWLDAGVAEVFAVFSTWSLSTTFSGAIVEARDLAPDAEGRPGFYVRNKGCILFFCKSVVRQGYVESQGDRLLRAYADPNLSDFRLSEESWEFAEDNGGSRVRYVLNMEPGFWVPPAIGPYLIKRKLGSKATEALDRIEAIAQDYGQPPGIIID